MKNYVEMNTSQKFSLTFLIPDFSYHAVYFPS